MEHRPGSDLIYCQSCHDRFTPTKWRLHGHNPSQVSCHRCRRKAVGYSLRLLLCSEHLVEALRRGNEVTFVDGRRCGLCQGHGVVHGQEVGPDPGGKWMRCTQCQGSGYDPELRQGRLRRQQLVHEMREREERVRQQRETQRGAEYEKGKRVSQEIERILRFQEGRISRQREARQRAGREREEGVRRQQEAQQRAEREQEERGRQQLIQRARGYGARQEEFRRQEEGERLRDLTRPQKRNTAIVGVIFVLLLLIAGGAISYYSFFYFPPPEEVPPIVPAAVPPSPTPTATPTPRPTATPTPRYAGGAPLDIPTIEAMIIRLTNQERQRAGLEPLQHDPSISRIAKMHSEDMILRGFRHELGGKDPTDRALDAGYDCRAYQPDGSYTYGLSENIFEYPRVRVWTTSTWSGTRVSEAYSTEEMAIALVQGWMDSPGHRANILDRDARRIGVGVAIEEQEEYGYTTETVYATQNFSACS